METYFFFIGWQVQDRHTGHEVIVIPGSVPEIVSSHRVAHDYQCLLLLLGGHALVAGLPGREGPVHWGDGGVSVVQQVCC